MAGYYPDVLAKRMAYDIDGTQCLEIGQVSGAGSVPSYGSISPIDRASYMAIWNDEDLTSQINEGTTSRAYALIFPELRDLYGTHFGWNDMDSTPVTASVSSDTTNGVDGTWASYTAGNFLNNGKQQLRTITGNTALGIKGIRWRTSYPFYRDLANVHLYGNPASGETLQRLELWHPTLDETLPAAYLDWGDVPRDTTATLTFRVKNLHGTLTANTPQVAMTALEDTTPSVVSQTSLSTDDISYTSQVTLANLAAGAISPLIYIKRETLETATLGVWWWRVAATASSWV